MGNDNNNQTQKHKLTDYKIPDNYHKNCHPNLLDFNIDEKEKFLLSGFILINSENQQWRKRVQPLLLTKYIFTPCRLITSNHYFQKGCCSSDLSESIDRVNVAYEPFIYTLGHEITTRKQKQNNFTEQQLWKIIKYLTKALIQWHSIYPLQKIESIMPQNIVINHKGNIRIITQCSFPKESFFHKPFPLYVAPEDKANSVIKYASQPNRYKILSADLFSIGMTVLDCLILQRNQSPKYSTLEQKLNQMWQMYEDKYSRQLKIIIETLLNEDYKKRPNPHDLVQLAQINQNKFTS